MQAASVDLRSYSKEWPEERHAFVQIVVPLSGSMDIDVGGLQQRLSPSRAVLINGNVKHSIVTSDNNRSLIVDLNECYVPEATLAKFSNKPFIDLTSRSASVARHMRRSIHDGEYDRSATRLWAELLVGSFTDERMDVGARLLTLKALIEIDPFQNWTVEQMASQVELSASRLHALFLEYFEATPHALLSQSRMKKICALLSSSSLPIAEIAARAGFSDQTALTRAMKKLLGTTPAAYRRTMNS
ncbi:AraC family transcriptional regulator [uncultured Agrobacterium sp.]|uniref:AraC family transcriptional regulator n=1 Tax=uncultured Agrobacterium sp. TaxID=157277 RepID=UPI0025FFA161|nr:AraC family transcriptional regulator [uncultured Agrobacterium sp.]